MKLMLTSAGIETDCLRSVFLDLLPCAPRSARALFIPTAAIFCDAIEVLPKCLEDLYSAGIPRENITVCDLREPLTAHFLSAFDCIYITGGDTQYLARRLAENGNAEALLSYLFADRGVVLGVSAGACVFSQTVPAHLNLLPSPLHVHCLTGTPNGTLSPSAEPIRLTNTQAILYTPSHPPQICG